MITLSLTTYERVTLVGWINQQRGDLSRIRRLFKLLDKLELTEEEKEAVGLEETVLPDGRVSQNWRDARCEFQIEFSRSEITTLSSVLNDQVWLANRRNLEMLEKIEAAKDRRKRDEEDD